MKKIATLMKSSRIASINRTKQSSSQRQRSSSAPPPTQLLPPSPTTKQWLIDQSIVMSTASAILGPLCDNLHSQYHVLTYSNDQKIDVTLPFNLLHIETTWWTPLLFGVAGIILGVSHPLLDELFAPSPEREANNNSTSTTRSIPSFFSNHPRGTTNPSWPFVLTSIACFVLTYYASAILDEPLLGQTLPYTPIPTLDAFLFTCALMIWAVFDGTKQGAFMALLTGVCGPLIESILIYQGLYSYAHPSNTMNIPTWIVWVYSAGGPAVGNLGRKVSSVMLLSKINSGGDDDS